VRAMLARIVVIAVVATGAGVVAIAARGADAPPAPTITAAPTDPTNSQSALFEWGMQEGFTYQCGLDEPVFIECESPFVSPVLAQGSHTFHVKAVDAGLESEPTSYTWTVDITAPDTSITGSPSDPSNDASPAFAFTGSEPGSTFECKLDSGSFTSCVSPMSVTVSAGTHSFSVKATDPAGNVDTTPASYTWRVDTTAPAAPQLRAKPSDPSNDPTPRFRWVVEEGVTYECTLDDTVEACASPHETDVLSEGSHSFEVRAKDAAGNLSAPAVWIWIVDLTPPDGVTGAGQRAPDANGWYNDPVTVDFASTDPTATCTSTVYSGPDDEDATVAGRCTDPAGNSADAAVTLKYDASAPTNVSGAPTGTPTHGWYGSPVTVVFTGSDATSGIETCTTSAYSGPDGIGVTVEGTCTDNAGNTSSPAFSSAFQYDGSRPEVGITAPADGSATSDTTPRFAGTTNNGPADQNVVSVRLVSGPTSVDGLSAPVAADGSWLLASPVELTPGEYRIEAVQFDALGRSDTSAAHTFTIDPSLPSVEISSPAHGTVTRNASPTISGSARTGVGFAPTVEVSVFAGTSIAPVPLQQMSAEISSTGEWSVPVSAQLADGPYTFLAEQSDLAGGTASDSIAVEIDTTPPEPLTGASVVPGYGYVKLHWTRPLSWDATDKVVITKQRVGKSTVTTVYRGAGTLFKDGSVRNGNTYVYTLRPRDAVGNEGTAAIKRARPTGFLGPRHRAHVTTPPLVRWVDVPKSTYANIQLYLVTSDGVKKIWSVWPVLDTLQLKSSWTYKGHRYRLRAGRTYRVYGWPGFGAKSEANYREWFGWIDFTYR
jgi:large repetitive protein